MASSLFVDIGNSNINFLIDKKYLSIPVTNFSKKQIPAHNKALISCVANHYIIDNFNNAQIAKTCSYKNLKFNYDLKQLGIDRFLSIVASYEKYPNNDLMIIDIGSFVTIDVVKKHTHTSLGIIPGVEKIKNIHKFYGNDSQKAWDTGIDNMLINYVKKYTQNFKGKVLITGGGQKMVKIPNAIYCQNLVIEGLKKIYE